MRSGTLLTALFAIALTPLHAREIRWFKDLKQASEEAQKTNQPMMIDFWADWCAPCKVMDTDVYTDSALAETVGRRIIAVRIHYDLQREVARKYNVTAIPHLIFADSLGTELMRHRGFLSAKDLNAVVNALPGEVTELNRLDRSLRENGKDFESLVEMGRKLRQAGFYQTSSGYLERALKQSEAKKNAGLRQAALCDMGLNALVLRDAKRAVAALERCVKEFPDSPRRAEYVKSLEMARQLP